MRGLGGIATAWIILVLFAIDFDLTLLGRVFENAAGASDAALQDIPLVVSSHRPMPIGVDVHLNLPMPDHGHECTGLVRGRSDSRERERDLRNGHLHGLHKASSHQSQDWQGPWG